MYEHNESAQEKGNNRNNKWGTFIKQIFVNQMKIPFKYTAMDLRNLNFHAQNMSSKTSEKLMERQTAKGQEMDIKLSAEGPRLE